MSEKQEVPEQAVEEKAPEAAQESEPKVEAKKKDEKPSPSNTKNTKKNPNEEPSAARAKVEKEPATQTAKNKLAGEGSPVPKDVILLGEAPKKGTPVKIWDQTSQYFGVDAEYLRPHVDADEKETGDWVVKIRVSKDNWKKVAVKPYLAKR